MIRHTIPAIPYTPGPYPHILIVLNPARGELWMDQEELELTLHWLSQRQHVINVTLFTPGYRWAISS